MAEIRELARYYGRVLWLAVRETRDCFELSRRAILMGIALYLASVLVSAIYLSPETVLKEIPGLIAWLSGLVLFILFLFVVNLIRAPHLIHEKQHTELVKLRKAELSERERELILRKLTDLNHSGYGLYLQFERGTRPIPYEEALTWITSTALYIGLQFDFSLASEFYHSVGRLPDGLTPTANRQLCAYFYPRLQKLVEIMQGVRDGKITPRTPYVDDSRLDTSDLIPKGIGKELNNLIQSSNLQIDYRPKEDGAFVQRGGGLTQYRVSVKSPVALRDAELTVSKLKLAHLETPLFNLHLRPMHDRDQESGTKRVIMRPEKEEFWDLITVFDPPPNGSGTVIIELHPVAWTYTAFTRET